MYLLGGATLPRLITSTLSLAGRITALDDETFHVAVKDGFVVVPTSTEGQKIFCRA
jgi:hypothetical protein